MKRRATMQAIRGLEWIVCTVLLACAAQAESWVLATKDASLEVGAGASAPRLLRIARPGGVAWRNAQEETLPAYVESNGVQLPLRWKWSKALSTADARHVELVYESAAPRLRLRWTWEARASFGPLEHTVTVENLGAEELWLPMVDSLKLDWQVPASESLTNQYVEKGANKPSDDGMHRDAVAEGYAWSGTSSTYEHLHEGDPREIIPAEVVWRAGAQEGWYAGIEFSGRTRIALARRGDSLSSVLGLNPDPGPFRTRLVAGGSFVAPTVFLGVFAGGAEGAGGQLRPWVRTVMGNPVTWKDPQYPHLVNNSWGSGMAVDEGLALRMIADSKELGLEMFGLDAGWFRGVGDWYPDPKKFPRGLGVIADAAHAAGLRFGIWVDWSQAALDTASGALNVRDPKVRDWLVADVGPEWKPEEFKGQTIDIGFPPARDYCAREVRRMIEDYKLDMLEHDGYLVAKGCIRSDHPHAPADADARVVHEWGGDFVLGSNETDVSYHAVRAYYSIYEQARREHPELLFEICADGGRMVDFGTAAHGDYFSITDSYDPLSNRRAFYDTSHLLPAAMLESYVEKWPAPSLAQFRYMLRSGMMGWLTVMQDTNAWTPEQHADARAEFAQYKAKLRPLIRDAELFHVSPRPDGVHWDGVEYWDSARGLGVVFAFRGTASGEARHSFKLAGLDPAKRYRLHFEDGSAADRVETGRALMDAGLAVDLTQPLSSELVFIDDGAAVR